MPGLAAWPGGARNPHARFGLRATILSIVTPQVVPAESQLVVIGSSAGGIEALSRLVASLPANFPAPIVIAQHLDPRRPSHLHEILARHATLPVRVVEDRETLHDGVIFVVPSNRLVEISSGDLRLRAARPGAVAPSIDVLLESAAGVFGAGLIAVILTGSGSDGSAGAWHVKKAGGAVVVENPATAMFPSMPGSIPPSLVDATADLDSIGAIVCDLLAAGHPSGVGAEPEELHDILERIHERSGVDFGSYKPATILRRLRGRMGSTSHSTLASYAAYLESDPEESARLVNSFLIKVTEFFRDPKLFDYLRESVLPELDRGRPARSEGASHLVGRLLDRRGGLLPGHHRCRSARRGGGLAGDPHLRHGYRPRCHRLRAPRDLPGLRSQEPAHGSSGPLLRQVGRRLRGRQTAAGAHGLRRARSGRARALPADRSAPVPERPHLLHRADAADRARNLRLLAPPGRSAGAGAVRDGPDAARAVEVENARLRVYRRLPGNYAVPPMRPAVLRPRREPGIPARPGHSRRPPRRPAGGRVVGVGGRPAPGPDRGRRRRRPALLHPADQLRGPQDARNPRHRLRPGFRASRRSPSAERDPGGHRCCTVRQDHLGRVRGGAHRRRQPDDPFRGGNGPAVPRREPGDRRRGRRAHERDAARAGASRRGPDASATRQGCRHERPAASRERGTHRRGRRITNGQSGDAPRQ